MRVRSFALIVAAALALAALYHFAPSFRRAVDGGRKQEQEPAGAEPEYRPYDLVASADQSIQRLQEQIASDPTISLNHVLLAQMYIRKARDTGDFESYQQAEAAVRRGLALDPDSLTAQATLAQVLCANHKFSESLALARRVYAKNPGKPQLLILVGDAHLELGHYEDAEKAYQELLRRDPLARLRSRQARLAELRGRTEEALRQMQQAQEEEARAALSPQGRAWYPTRLAEIHLGAGHLEQAETHYQEALKEAPHYHAALAGLGKVRAAQGRYEEAIELYKLAAAVSADLGLLADLGDLYAKTGKDLLAKVYYDRIEQTSIDLYGLIGKDRMARLGAGGIALKAADGSAYARERALFYCNHDRKLPEALELARKDLDVRKDIYAYDTLAWALYKNQRSEEAAAAMAQALKLGTRDARLFFHAGMIAARLGQKDKARAYLEQALAINPRFSPFLADEARRALAEMRAPGANY